jgi:hypothetical protein
MQELSHFDHIPKQLKKSKVNWKKVNADVSMTSPKTPHDADVAEISGNM